MKRLTILLTFLLLTIGVNAQTVFEFTLKIECKYNRLTETEYDCKNTLFAKPVTATISQNHTMIIFTDRDKKNTIYHIVTEDVVNENGEYYVAFRVKDEQGKYHSIQYDYLKNVLLLFSYNSGDLSDIVNVTKYIY